MVQCPDAKGVVAALAQLLFGFNCNILQSDQFSDETLKPSRFFQRIHFDFSDISVGTGNLAVLERAVDELAKRYEMDWKVSGSGTAGNHILCKSQWLIILLAALSTNRISSKW